MMDIALGLYVSASGVVQRARGERDEPALAVLHEKRLGLGSCRSTKEDELPNRVCTMSCPRQ